MHAPALLACLVLGQVASEPAAPLPPREAAARMTVPPGFKVSLFAAEPDVQQPIAFTFDDRGRLWVCECYSYPKWHRDPKQGKDRVLIFEDTDGDGVFDKRTVFADNLSNLSGIEYGFGGIWLCSTPHLLFIPIKEGEDKPAGPAEIKLDGWSLQAGHNVFSSLKWGPDGWLYGCNGILATSKVGPPGTPEKDRVPINCGVWRYHPTRKKFEAYAWGTTNPWGLDWDEHGEMFISNCVIHHLWHVVPGAHFERMFGQDLNPHVYGLMKSCADHIHWGGGNWTTSRGGKGEHSVAGGGHAHAGCMIYLGDNWPERYRNGVFLCNLHGTRINHDVLERNGSSYVARHGKDFAFSSDPWFRGLALNYGPDGGVFVLDWSDTGECHNYKEVHQSSGRIFKITYGKPEHKKIDLAKLSDEELVKLQLHRNEWFVRHARRILQERASKGNLGKHIPALLADNYQKTRVGQILYDPGTVNQCLRLFWALQAIGALEWDAEKRLGPAWAAFEDEEEHLRAWSVRLLLDDPQKGAANSGVLSAMLRREPSPKVRLAIASGLQRMPLPDRSSLGLSFIYYSPDDTHDPYLPLMTWYAIEPVTPILRDGGFPDSGIHNLYGSRTPLVRECIAHRLALVNDSTIGSVITSMLLKTNPLRNSASWQRDVLRGLQAGLADRRSVPMPVTWKLAFPFLMESPLEEVRERALTLAVKFGDERALTTMRQILIDDKAALRLRENALQTLLQKRPADLVPTLHALLKETSVAYSPGSPTLRGAALRGLASYNDPKTPQFILDEYARFTTEDKADAIETLTSRVPYALALLKAVEKKQVPRDDLSNFTALQIQALGDKDLTAMLGKVWGSIRPAAAEKLVLMSKFKKSLTPDVLKKANKSLGRALFLKSCAACHRLFDDGGKIGPDITGSQRHNLDYILENILDPSAIVPADYQVAIITTTAGRTISGLIKQETERALTVQTLNELIVLPRSEIDNVRRTKTSMMPDGLLDNLRFEEVRDLIAYLASPVQVPLGKK